MSDKNAGRSGKTSTASGRTITLAAVDDDSGFPSPTTEHETMSDSTRELVVLMTKGADHEMSSVGFTIANGGITAGLKVYAFLTSAAVDLVRLRAVEHTHVSPMEPLEALIASFLSRGGTIWACPPCVTSRGYSQEDFIDGVSIVGASAMHERLLAGAATLSF